MYNRRRGLHVQQVLFWDCRNNDLTRTMWSRIVCWIRVGCTSIEQLDHDLGQVKELKPIIVGPSACQTLISQHTNANKGSRSILVLQSASVC